MVIFADDSWGLLFWLSRGGAKESKLKEIKGNGEGTKTKTLCKNSMKKRWNTLPPPSSFLVEI